MTTAQRTILVPLDGSRLAEAVLPPARIIADGWDACLILLHVLERRAPETVHGQAHLRDAAAAHAYLETVANRLSEGGTRVESHVHERVIDDVPTAIAEHADELDAELIAICTHGSGGLRRLLMGDNAQQTLRHTTRPVLLVRPAAGGAPPPFGHAGWVLAVDPAGHGARRLPLVASLARALDTELHLVTVMPTPLTLPPRQRAAALLSPATAASLLEFESRNAATYLEALCDNLQADGVAASATVLRGNPVARVAGMLRDRGAELLVILTHGRAGVPGMLAGSFGASIVERVTVPLLLVPVPTEPSRT